MGMFAEKLNTYALFINNPEILHMSFVYVFLVRKRFINVYELG